MYKFPLTWYICKICRATFSSKDKLIIHKRKEHRASIPIWYICKDCSATFHSKDELILHKKKKHSSEFNSNSSAPKRNIPSTSTTSTTTNWLINSSSSNKIENTDSSLSSSTSEDEPAGFANQNIESDSQKNPFSQVGTNIIETTTGLEETQFYDKSRSPVSTPNDCTTANSENENDHGDQQKNHVGSSTSIIATCTDPEAQCYDESRSLAVSTPNVQSSNKRLLNIQIKLQRLSSVILNKYITSSLRCPKEVTVPVAGTSSNRCDRILNVQGSVNHDDVNNIVTNDNEIGKSTNSSEKQPLAQEPKILQDEKFIPNSQSDVEANNPPLPQIENSVIPTVRFSNVILSSKLLKRARARHGKKKHQCNDCNKSFSQMHHWVEHVQVHVKKSYSCTRCRKTFSTQVSLKTHLKLHVPKKLHSCKLCSKKYFDKNNLEKHAETHEKETSYTCEFCCKKFLSEGGLKIHRNKLHENKDSYSCTYCGKDFSSGCSLKKHIRVHASNKSFTCNYCGKTFSNSVTLRCHNVKMHADNSYACYLCGKSLANSRELKNHIDRMHEAIEKNSKESVKGHNFTPEKKPSIKVEQTETKRRANINTETKTSRPVIKKELIEVKKTVPTMNTNDKKRKRQDTNKITKQLIKIENSGKKTMQLVKLENAGKKAKQLKTKQLVKLETAGKKTKQLVKLETAGKKTKQLVKLENAEKKTKKLVKLENSGKKTKQLLGAGILGNKTRMNMKIKMEKKQKGLKNTTMTYSEKQKYFCAFCEKPFTSKSNMHRHMLNLQGTCSKKRFSCNLCGKRFALRSNMLKHTATHAHS